MKQRLGKLCIQWYVVYSEMRHCYSWEVNSDSVTRKLAKLQDIAVVRNIERGLLLVLTEIQSTFQACALHQIPAPDPSYITSGFFHHLLSLCSIQPILSPAVMPFIFILQPVSSFSITEVCLRQLLVFLFPRNLHTDSYYVTKVMHIFLCNSKILTVIRVPFILGNGYIQVM